MFKILIKIILNLLTLFEKKYNSFIGGITVTTLPPIFVTRLLECPNTFIIKNFTLLLLKIINSFIIFF